MPLLLAWQFEGKTMGKISKTEWENGTQKLECVVTLCELTAQLLMIVHRISSLPLLQLALQELDDLLIADKPIILSKSAANGSWPKLRQTPNVKLVTSDPYQRRHYYGYASDKKAAFGKLYAFCFALAKPESSRNLDMEVSVILPTQTVDGRPIVTD